MRRILLSGASMLVAAGIIVGGTAAYFIDPEISPGNTLAAGIIDLQVDNESYYNGAPSQGTTWLLPANLDGHLFFDFDDLKPSDEGEDTISLHIGSNDAWACMDITLVANDDRSTNEPERKTGDEEENPANPFDGELAGALQFAWWADDGDNVYEDGEPLLTQGVETLEELTGDEPWSVALADSATNVWTENANEPIPGNTTRYLGKAWCFGTLTPASLPADSDEGPFDDTVAPRGPGFLCNGEHLGNEYQTDGVTLDLAFRAMQARHNPAFMCSDPEEEPVPCEAAQRYADEVVFVSQGKRKNGSAVLANRSDASKTLGAPQSLGTTYDNPVVAGSFFSLGFPFTEQQAHAEIILAFNDNYVVNGPGPDLKLFEVTGGSSYPDEKVDVYVGNSASGPWVLVGNSVTRDAEIDLGAVLAARYVRVVEASDKTPFEAEADGYDLDALAALNCVVSPAPSVTTIR